MRWLACIAALALLGCNTGTDKSTEAAGPDHLVELSLPKSDHVTVKLMFRAGSIDDPAGKEGLTYMAANFVGQGGSQQHTKAEIDEILYPLAVGVGLTVDKEVTVFTMTAHKDNLDKAYGIMRGLILEPRYDAGDFERVKKAAMKAVTEDVPMNNDEVLSKRALDTLMFANHPYGHLVEGSKSGLDSITVEDAKAHYQSLFCQKRLTIGLAGGYDDAFKKRVLDDMKALPEGSDVLKVLPEVPMPNGFEGRVVVKDRAFGTAIFMGYPMDLDRSDDDFAALMVANSYLGEHRKSYGVLYDRMRSKRSLNYGDYSYIEWYQSGHATQLPYPGFPRRQNFFSIWIRPVQIGQQFKGIEGLDDVTLGNGVHSIRHPLYELKKLIDNGMTEEDFQRTRSFLMGYCKLYVQSPERRLGFLMDSRFYGRQDYITEVTALLEKLTLEDVNHAIRKYLQTDNMYLAVITDQSEGEGLAKALKENLSAPIVYKPVVQKGLSKDILDEDKAIDAFKLNVTKMEIVKNTDLFQ